MAPRNPRNQSLGAALDGIAARLAVPFTARDVGVDLGAGERFEADDGFREALADRTVGRAQGDGRKHAVAPSGHQLKAMARSRLVLGLGQDATAEGNDRIARQHVRCAAVHSLRLFQCHARGIGTRLFALERGFVDVGGNHARRLDAEPRDQFAAARGGRGEDEAGRSHPAGQNWPGPPRPGMKR